ncbi:DUF5411 family protein [Bacillus sp. 1P06AnD]|uniref:DUF5411 family protein n=1 Tax=Bacillus sp. 1P06AnD TaxID=3132208 RepID=UPI00399FE0F2
MSKLTMGAFALLLFIFFTVFAFSQQYLTVADSDNETSVTNSTRNAMTQAINWGNARVNEDITINEKAAIQAVVRQYGDNADFFDGERYVNVHSLSENPPMLAVDTYTTVNTPFQGMANRFTKENKSDENITRSREIVIFEAKKLIK